LPEALKGPRDDPLLGLVGVVEELVWVQVKVVVLPLAVPNLNKGLGFRV
jgi:hypothetical protein